MLTKRFFLVFFLLILVAAAGCAPSASTPSRGMEAPGAAPAEVAPQAPAQPAADGGDFYTGSTSSSVPGALDRRIVLRNASLTIVVDDPGKSMDAISRMAEDMGGFVVVSDLHKAYTRGGAEVPEASITVRVPAEKLNDALAQIKKQVKDPVNDVRSENVSGQDVTKEYTDLSSQLKNYEDAEAQLREILASATKTEDVLAVFQQLTQVRQQIEVLKGQIQYYDEASALSSISIQIQAQAAVQPLEVGGWKPAGIARNALQALIDTLQFLGSAAIWILIYVLPVALVIFIPVRLLWWLFRRGAKNRKKPLTPTIPPPAPPAEG